MELISRIEAELGAVLAPSAVGPPLLAAAIRHAVFPGGARIRPQLCLGVSQACGADQPPVATAAAAAIELLHCASLVHDDLPCFDDAPLRRGRPAVHKAYGQPLAVLAGDALIVMAFQSLARIGELAPQRLPRLLGILGPAAGALEGLVAGQAWECESQVDLGRYHRAKTGALFAAATMAGAAAAGRDPAPWRPLGEALGAAYQTADDIRDVLGEAAESGKTSGRDAALGRPSAVREYGLAGAIERFVTLINEATATIPACAGAGALRTLIEVQSERLLPKTVARRAA